MSSEKILIIDRQRLLALLTCWHVDEVTEEDEAREKGEELIRRMEAEASVDFNKDYHPRRCLRCGGVILTTGFCSNDCSFDRHLQDCEQGWLGHPDHPDVQEGRKCGCKHPDL